MFSNYLEDLLKRRIEAIDIGNYEDLLKIEKATSGFFKGKARYMLSMRLRDCRDKIEALKGVPEEDRFETLRQLMNEYQAKRHQALNAGASGFGHPEWASASACEGWIHELLGGDEEGIRQYSLKANSLIERK
ncbi:hypothetical protein OAI75_01710 [Woeseiaceae bacterium]|nr:hypothetical protein [Woeseiaceae bacterium]